MTPMGCWRTALRAGHRRERGVVTVAGAWEKKKRGGRGGSVFLGEHRCRSVALLEAPSCICGWPGGEAAAGFVEPCAGVSDIPCRR